MDCQVLWKKKKEALSSLLSQCFFITLLGENKDERLFIFVWPSVWHNLIILEGDLVNQKGPLLERNSPCYVYSSKKNGISLARQKGRISENSCHTTSEANIGFDSIFLGIQTRTNISVNITFYILSISLCKTVIGWIFSAKGNAWDFCMYINRFLSFTKHKQFTEYLITMHRAQWKASKKGRVWNITHGRRNWRTGACSAQWL